MDAGYDHGRIGLDSIEYGIGKPAHQSPAHTAIDDRKRLRQALNTGEDCFGRPQEFQPQAGRLILVPKERVSEIRLRSRLKSEPRHLAESVEKSVPNLRPRSAGTRIGFKLS